MKIQSKAFLCVSDAAASASFLQRFFAATGGLSPEARGKYLEEPPPGAPDIDEAHQVRPGQVGKYYPSYGLLKILDKI
jgi:hypothetical protein